MTKEEFYEELKSDAEMEQRQEMYEERQLRTDYDVFLEKFSPEIETAVDAVKEVKRLFEMYDHEFDIRDIEDYL